MKNITVYCKNDEISIDVKTLGYFGRMKGLMFEHRDKAVPVLFEFNISKTVFLHSFFVFFPFFAVWLNQNNEVISSDKVFPFTTLVSSPNNTKKLLEIPINGGYDKIIKQLITGKC